MRPSQLRTVADRRFEDAYYLLKSGRNARANGAMYLGGFVIECLLKALLMEKYPWLQNRGRSEGTTKTAEREIWYLCYRGHDLERISSKLPEVTRLLHRSNLLPSFRNIGAWTIFARYSPYMTEIREASEFLLKVKGLKECLRKKYRHLS